MRRGGGDSPANWRGVIHLPRKLAANALASYWHHRQQQSAAWRGMAAIKHQRRRRSAKNGGVA